MKPSRGSFLRVRSAAKGKGELSNGSAAISSGIYLSGLVPGERPTAFPSFPGPAKTQESFVSTTCSPFHFSKKSLREIKVRVRVATII